MAARRHCWNGPSNRARASCACPPTWVPRSFCVPGRRIKLHPDDYYALGGDRGGIDERWFSSTTPADNGPMTSQDEGLSFIVVEDGSRAEKVTLRDAVAELKGQIIGERIWKAHKGWPMYSKFFDNKGPLPHHVHHRDSPREAGGHRASPSRTTSRRRSTTTGRTFPYTFFGLQPGHDEGPGPREPAELHQGRQQDHQPLRRLPPGAGHRLGRARRASCTPRAACAPTSRRRPPTCSPCTSPSRAMPSSPRSCSGRTARRRSWATIDYLIEVLDWEANVDPDFAAKHFMRPGP